MTHTLAYRGPSAHFDLFSGFPAAARQAAPPALAGAAAEPARVRGQGYVYLSTSAEMPGFIQLASSINDPRHLAWSLESFTGITRFHTVFAVRTRECTALMAAMQRALQSDQIPHHPDLYKISLRFARQILLNEAAPFRPADKTKPAASRSRAPLWALAVAALAALALFAAPHHGASPASAPAPSAPALPGYHTHAPLLRM